MVDKIKLARIFLQIGLAFVFAYASLEVFFNPEGFLKYVPDFVTQLANIDLFLTVFSVIEGFLVLWLLSGRYLREAAIVSFIAISCITLFNLEHFSVLFRNVAIAFAALALVMLGGKK